MSTTELDPNVPPELHATTVAQWLRDAAELVRAGERITDAADHTMPPAAEVYYPEYRASTKWLGIAYDAIMEYAGTLGTFPINEMNGKPYFPAILAWFDGLQHAGTLANLMDCAAADLEAQAGGYRDCDDG